MTIGRFTTEEDIDYAVSRCKTGVAQTARAVPAVGDVPGTASTSTIQWAAH